ncbi:ciliogenesis-associated TTC17-interacting protein-like [Sitophilus oryzae]|uniref:Ciliogenesis-associated TTC17-interacting protein-like n=1 Tax=Sitophilus oryzae TaxID=7048 RepID=A0A6J2YPS4_SITOR|nr:ciliogenesis-associated TTC17-interacting protein-like [Sitophilus oryzae]
MANATKTIIDTLDFHPTYKPYGMDNYRLEILTKGQQKYLNNHKTERIRQDHKYLYDHPEIQAMLQIIMRKLLLERPSHDIETFIGRYFVDSWAEIEEQVEGYMKKLPSRFESKTTKDFTKDEKHVILDDSRYDMYSDSPNDSVSDEISGSTLCRDILEEIIDAVEKDDLIHSISSELVEISEGSEKEYSDDDEVYIDLGLDFDIDFAGYHDEDD